MFRPLWEMLKEGKPSASLHHLSESLIDLVGEDGAHGCLVLSMHLSPESAPGFSECPLGVGRCSLEFLHAK